MKPKPRLQAVIFDWAGTIIDFGSCAPVEAFVTTFARAGITITTAEARAPMGSAKRDHIAALLAMSQVAKRWREAHDGASHTDADIDRLYADFIPTQTDVLPRHADLIPRALEAVAAIRARNIRIGSTTGYSREMMDVVAPLAEKQGLIVDHVATGDGLPGGRPAPWMCFQNMQTLGAFPPSLCVKVGDTQLDIEEGVNAGMWTIGVAATGNAMGISLAEYEALPGVERRQKTDAASQTFRHFGAHYVVDSVGDLMPILSYIEDRLDHGEKP